LKKRLSHEKDAESSDLSKSAIKREKRYHLNLHPSEVVLGSRRQQHHRRMSHQQKRPREMMGQRPVESTLIILIQRFKLH